MMDQECIVLEMMTYTRAGELFYQRFSQILASE